MSVGVAGRTLATGLMAGATMAGIILANYLPLLGTLFLALAGLPGLLVVLAWGGPWFIVYGTVTLSLAFFWGGFISSLMLIPLMLFPAGVLAWAINLDYEPMKALGVSLTVACAFSFLLWGISPLFGEIGTKLWAMGDQFKAQGKLAEEQIKALNQNNEIEEDKMTLFLDNFRMWTDFIALLIPFTFMFIWHLISLGTFYIGAMIFATRFHFSIRPLPAFAAWKFDWSIIWIMFLGWFLFYGAEAFDSVGMTNMVKMVGANCLAISKILFFITGLSLLFHFFEVYQIGHPLRMGLSFLAVIFNQLFVWLGIVDIWMDFRAPKIPKKVADEDDQDSFF